MTRCRDLPGLAGTYWDLWGLQGLCRARRDLSGTYWDLRGLQGLTGTCGTCRDLWCHIGITALMKLNEAYYQQSIPSTGELHSREGCTDCKSHTSTGRPSHSTDGISCNTCQLYWFQPIRVADGKTDSYCTASVGQEATAQLA